MYGVMGSNMTVMYEVTGYDSKTEKLVVSFDIPVSCHAAALQVAGAKEIPDPNFWSYPLDARQVGEIAELIGSPIQRPGLNFFLEPYAAPPQRVHEPGIP